MNSPDPPENPPAGQPPRPQHISARVPDAISPGVFSSGVLVMTGNTEFVLDFVQNLGQPAQVAARVVLPHATMPQFIEALKKNLELYANRFGTPPDMPRPQPPARKPSIQEIYDDLKISDETLVGAYANGVMIGHVPRLPGGPAGPPIARIADQDLPGIAAAHPTTTRGPSPRPG